MNAKPHQRYFITIVIVFTLVGITLAIFRTLVTSRILHPSWFTDWLVTPSEWIAKWLKTPTCEVPCWGNITPGATNRVQAKSLLKSNREITSIEETDVIPYGQVININLDNDIYTDDATILFDDKNIVQEIDLATFGSNLYLVDVISAYGHPNQLLLHNLMYDFVTVDLLYPKSGMVISLFLPNLNAGGREAQVEIDKYSEILHIYLTTSDLKHYFDTFEINDAGLYCNWEGYTKYP